MDHAKAELIRKDLDATLKEFAKKHGLSVSPARGTYTGSDVKFTAVFGDSGVPDVNPEYVRNLMRNGLMYGLNSSHIGKTFNFGQLLGVTFQGLKGKKAVFKTKDGSVRLADAELVAQILRAAA